ncbi:DUF4185 domain-containing protein [candidate division KSB1 bacterium]|nr:DUF4185 domain-containing protein [candidate division KSB1 bacterium]
MKFKVEPIPEYEQHFRQGNTGWWGGDLAFSLPLDANRVLWLFGDSFVHHDPQRPGRHGTPIIHNTCAIQTNPLDHSPRLQFYWPRESNAAAAFFTAADLPGFIWPMGAIFYPPQLFVFTVRIVQSNQENVFGFRQIGNDIFCIENPTAPPDQWKMTMHSLPWQKAVGSFGSNFLIHASYLYIYGFRQTGFEWTRRLKCIIARIPLDRVVELHDMRHWEFLNGSNGGWAATIENLKPVFSHATTEFSVTFLPAIEQFVLITYCPKLKNQITLRLSKTPYGPFTKPQVIYNCPESTWNPRYFCYAAKAHPELARTDREIIVTYLTNSRRLGDCIEDLRIYFPRFLRVTVA